MKKFSLTPSIKHYINQVITGLAIFFIGFCIHDTYFSTPAIQLESNHSTITQETTLENERFTTFTKELFAAELSSSTLGLHYTLEHPEDYGISEPVVSFGSFQFDENEMLLSIENQIGILNSFDYESLQYENQITYDVLTEYLAQAQDTGLYYMFYEPLTPYTGLHTQLPILLSEFPVHSLEDINIYIELLKAVKPYFESLVEFQIQKSELGLFMTDSALDSVIEDCQAFINIPENYLITTFETRIKDMEGLSQQDYEAYCNENTLLLDTHVLESYRYLVNELKLLQGTNTNELGLCHYENGSSYYQYLLESSTGTFRTVDEIDQLITQQISYDLTDLQEALLLESDLVCQFFDKYTSPQEMLDYLKDSMDYMFPTPPETDFIIKDVPSELEDYLSPAFYLIPAIDATTPNTIYLNNAHMGDALNMYTTLAHEGYPGHLYQTTYFQETNPDPIRSIINYGGYVEGWATYVEMCSYYMIDLPDASLQQKNASLMLGLYAYTDLGIHSHGWTLLDAVDFYKTYGITDTQAIMRIYELVKATPTNYMKYYLGYVEFLELKKECINAWGDEFTQKRFHQEVLELGPVSFQLLRKYMI